MEVSIFEVLFFLTLLVYTATHIMVFGAVLSYRPVRLHMNVISPKCISGGHMMVFEV